MLFIPITALAATFQVARNALQRKLMGDAGPWGATLVRFLFGLPFSLLFVAACWAIWPDSQAHFTARFWVAASLGAAAQVGATAALLTSMGKSGFALGAAFQQSSLPFAALVGWALLGEKQSLLATGGIVLASAGLLALSWPKGGIGKGAASGVVFGLVSGACYAIALNAYRAASLEIDPHHAAFAAVVTSSTTQAMQSAGLVAWLAWKSPASLRAVLRGWRASLGAGFAGAPASALWVKALALELAPDMIRVNTVHPGVVDNDMCHNDAIYALFGPDLPEAERTRETLAPRFTALNALPNPWVQPVDISNAVLWLASDEARYVTGVAIPIDSGWLIK